MATPRESITTVSGRRCTRSRVRTAALVSSSPPPPPPPPPVTTTQLTTSTVQLAPAIQTSAAAEIAPPIALPPVSSSPPLPSLSPAPIANSSPSVPAEQPPAAVTTTSAADPPAIGTISLASISSARASPLANVLAPSPPAAVPQPPAQESQPVAEPLPVAPVGTTTPLAPATTVSDTIFTAVSSPSSLPVPFFTAPAASNLLQTSLIAGSEPQTNTASSPTPFLTSITGEPQPTAVQPSVSAGGEAAGVIAPNQDPDVEAGLTIPNRGNVNIGSIVGGVVGGVAVLMAVCALLFFCLRRRKSRQPNWIEKKDLGPTFSERLKAFPAGIKLFVAKLKGNKKGPSGNPYQRHSQRDSITSIYSTHSNGRSRSISEPQGFLAAGVPKHSSSRKNDRKPKRKQNGSISSQFAGIIEEKDINPFADPEPPRTLQLLNPDAASPRGPLTPQPAATSAGITKDPFTFDFNDVPGATDWIVAQPPAAGHKRTQSSASLQGAHPSNFPPTANKSLTNTSIGPPPPSQAPLPNQKRRSSIAYPAFNATSTSGSRESNYTLYDDLPTGRSVNTTFTRGRTVRQSDPFDLDRPEVLGFGNVAGRREVRESVTRQASRGKRTSSFGNWVTATDVSYGPFSRNSAKPAPLRSTKQ